MIEKYGRGCLLHDTLKTYGRNWIGAHTMILENVILGYPTSDVPRWRDQAPSVQVDSGSRTSKWIEDTRA